MKLAHSIAATVGLIVIVGFVVAALADEWVTLLVVLVIAAGAGEITRRAARPARAAFRANQPQVVLGCASVQK